MLEKTYKFENKWLEQKALINEYNILGEQLIEIKRSYYKECGPIIRKYLEQGVAEDKLQQDEEYLKACYLKQQAFTVSDVRNEIYNRIVELRKKDCTKKIFERRGEEGVSWLEIPGEVDYKRNNNELYYCFNAKLNEDGRVYEVEECILDEEEN